MKTLKEYKLPKQPLSIASGIVLFIGCIALLVAAWITIRFYGLSFDVKQLSLFATTMMVFVLAIGSQFVICDSVNKGSMVTTAMFMFVVGMIGCVITAYVCAGPFVGNYTSQVVYCVYGFVTGMIYLGLTFGLMHVSVSVSMALFGCTMYMEDSKDEDENKTEETE